MKTFTRDYRISGAYPEPFAGYFSGMKSCVFDIESTGLDPARSKVCLTAMLTMTDSSVRITQFLAENHYEENRVLDATVGLLEREGIDYLITYNGQAFDIPFMNRRLEAQFSHAVRMYDLDLYRFISKSTDLRSRIGSLSQKALEDFYGIGSDRRDTISGRDSVRLFDEYSLSGNSTIEKIILTHNREDVLQLHRLMYHVLRDVEDPDAAMGTYGIPVLGGRYSARPHAARHGSILRVTGEQFGSPVSAAFFPDADSPLTVSFSSLTSSYEIDAPLGRLGDDLYIDAESLGLDLSEDPDCVNGYLILGPRTVNLAAAALVEKADAMLRG